MSQPFLYKKIGIVIFGTIALALLSAFIVSASWNGPTNPPPQQDMGAPLTPTNTSQTKLGPLELNFSGTNLHGLLVNGTGSGSGKVLLTPPPPLPSFPEKLTLLGNMRISGILKPNDDAGGAGKLLTASSTLAGDRIEWQDRLGWITLVGNPSHSATDCNASLPAACPSSFVEYGPVYCLAETNGYSAPFRICHKPF